MVVEAQPQRHCDAVGEADAILRPDRREIYVVAFVILQPVDAAVSVGEPLRAALNELMLSENARERNISFAQAFKQITRSDGRARRQKRTVGDFVEAGEISARLHRSAFVDLPVSGKIEALRVFVYDRFQITFFAARPRSLFQ